FFAYVLIILVVTYLQVSVIGMQTFGLWDVPWLPQTMDRIWHMVLPSLLAASGGIAVLSRYVRSQMLEVEGQDYVRTARAKGLPWEMVHYKHALRNALLPFVTMFGLVLPGLIGGSVIILTINFIAAVLVLIGTFISDLLYVIVDPRIRL
ncbi:MAG: ABC transporter permease, partial [Desulfobacterales bacterium]|nr:ABC transporter permease [Desulfobacterales bacterium]